MAKKIIAAVISAMLLATSVCAMEIDRCDTNIRISGTAEPGSDVRLNVINSAGELIWLDSVTSGYDGIYAMDMSTPAADNTEEYILTVNGTDIQSVTVEGNSDVVMILKTADNESFAEKIAVYAKRFGYDAEIFNKVADKSLMKKLFQGEELSSAETVTTAYYKACGLCLLNEAGRSEVLDVLEKYNKYLVPGYAEDMKKLTRTQKEKFAIALIGRDYISFSDFLLGYSSALADAKKFEGSQSQGGGTSGGSVSGGRGGYVAPPAATEQPTAQPTEQPMTSSEPFTDLNDVEWAKESILKLYTDGIVKGKADGYFAPNDPITREEFTAMLVRCFKLDGSSEVSFSDIPGGAWYEEYVSAAAANGIISGISENQFGVGMNLTREDCAVMCSRIIDKLGVLADADKQKFSDDEDIAEYAGQAVYKLKGLGILSGTGDNKFEPKGICTRAMTAKIIDLLGECCK